MRLNNSRSGEGAGIHISPARPQGRNEKNMEKAFAQMTQSEFQSLKKSRLSLEYGFSGKGIGIKYKDIILRIEVLETQVKNIQQKKDDYVDAITPKRKKSDVIKFFRDIYKTNSEILELIKKRVAYEHLMSDFNKGNPVISWVNFQKTKIFNR